jgi:hypothetical protein
MKDIQFRLIKVSDDNPQGEIVGYLKIENGAVWLNIGLKKNDDDRFEYNNLSESYSYVNFTDSEPIAPFCDKDGGELYAGDNVSAMSLVYDREVCGRLELTPDGRWCIVEKTNFFYTTHTCINFIKLGTIHDKETP